MSKYIRTKDGRIIDTETYLDKCWVKQNQGGTCKWETFGTGCGACRFNELNKVDIIKQADTIEELIMPGDLVMVGLTILIVRETMKDELVGHDMGLIRKNAVEVLWIKQGKDFVKCAVKKEGDDYLTLCD